MHHIIDTLKARKIIAFTIIGLLVLAAIYKIGQEAYWMYLSPTKRPLSSQEVNANKQAIDAKNTYSAAVTVGETELRAIADQVNSRDMSANITKSDGTASRHTCGELNNADGYVAGSTAIYVSVAAPTQQTIIELVQSIERNGFAMGHDGAYRNSSGDILVAPTRYDAALKRISMHVAIACRRD
jgi:hypothetical protein